jgi:tetratricopeptide (TPR) repeat protein
VGRELGVRYLLEGSVRKAGNRVRINAQLVDAVNGNHLWSERYDREQKDLFKLQNEILNNIVTALDVKLVEGEQAKLYRKATDNPEAYDAFAKGFNLFRQFRKDANSLAQQYLSRAIELDPKYAEAMGLLGSTHWADARFGWSASGSQSVEKGKELAIKALTIDDKTYLALSALSMIHLLEKDYDRCMEIREQAFSINPNGADSNALMAWTLSLVGREEEALPYMKTAMRLSPFYPPWYLSTLCDIFRLTGRHDEAIAVARAIIELNYPHGVEAGRLYLASILIQLGRDEEARKLAAEYRKLRPTFSLKRFKKSRIYKDPKITEKLINQLRKAGFPD